MEELKYTILREKEKGEQEIQATGKDFTMMKKYYNHINNITDDRITLWDNERQLRVY